MKTKTIFIVSYLLVVLGWFPFMFLAAFSHTPEVGGVLAMLGFMLCVIGGVVCVMYLSADLFKSIDELKNERENYYEATRKYERASEELKRKLLNVN